MNPAKPNNPDRPQRRLPLRIYNFFSAFFAFINPFSSRRLKIELKAVENFPITAFTKVKDIGEGGFGTVALYNYQPPNGPVEKRAIKLLHQYNEAIFNKEVLPFLRLRHENLLRFYGLTKTTVFHGIVLEYMPGGNLREVIYHQTPYRYSLKDVLKWNIHSASALEYMHNLNGVDENNQPKYPRYIHRDIKPENMLLDGTYQTLKITDFGLSKEIEHSENTRGTGTRVYMAPEVLLGEHYNETCDVYSWTLTFWECLTGVIPFLECQKLAQLGQAKQQPNYLATVKTASQKFNKIIQSGSNPNRYKRLSMSSWRKLLEILYNHSDFGQRQAQANTVCLWNGHEFFYCNGFDEFDWNTLDSNIGKFETELSRLRKTFSFNKV